MDWPLKLHVDQQTPLHFQIKATLIAFFAIAVTIFIYLPGIGGSFLFDDVVNLSFLEKINGVTSKESALEFIFGNGSGTLGRPVSMLSFLINDQFWGGDPASYKYTNLMLHVLCGVLIIGFFHVLLKNLDVNSRAKNYLPVMVGAIWLAHPFNVSTTLYIIQRMTQLMSIFSLLTLIMFIWGRQLQASNSLRSYIIMSSGMIVFGLLSIFSKENGVSILFYILVLEFTLFRNTTTHRHYKYWLSAFVYIPLIILLVFFIDRWPSFITTYELRDFTLWQRLLTESRILFDYLSNIIIPTSGGTGVIHDDFVISRGLFEPVSSFFALTGILVIVGASIRYAKKVPHLSFGVLWFFAGHLLESTFIPLELYFEHRNYLPMIGPLYSLCYYIFYFADKQAAERANLIPAIFATLYVLVASLFTYQSATIWGNSFDLLKIWAYEHPHSARAQRLYGQALAKVGHPEQAINHLSTVYRKLDYDFSMPLAVSFIACQHNLANPYQFDEVMAFTRKARFTSSIVPNMKTLVNMSLQRGCPPFTPDRLVALLEASTQIQDMFNAATADLYILKSQIMVNKGLLSASIEALDQAFEAKKDPVILIRKAELLYSAGLFADAQRILDAAEQLDNRSGNHRYTNKAIINMFRKKIASQTTDQSISK